MVFMIGLQQMYCYQFYIPPNLLPIRYVRKVDDKLAILSLRGHFALINVHKTNHHASYSFKGCVQNLNCYQHAAVVDYYDTVLKCHVTALKLNLKDSLYTVKSRAPQRLSVFTKIGLEEAVITVYIDGSYKCWNADRLLFEGKLRLKGPIAGIDITEQFVGICCGDNKIHIYDILSKQHLTTLLLPPSIEVSSLILERSDVGFKIKFVTSKNTLMETFTTITGKVRPDFDRSNGEKLIQLTKSKVTSIKRSSTCKTYRLCNDDNIGFLRNNQITWKPNSSVDDFDVDGSSFVWTNGYDVFEESLKKNNRRN